MVLRAFTHKMPIFPFWVRVIADSSQHMLGICWCWRLIAVTDTLLNPKLRLWIMHEEDGRQREVKNLKDGVSSSNAQRPLEKPNRRTMLSVTGFQIPNSNKLSICGCAQYESDAVAILQHWARSVKSPPTPDSLLRFFTLLYFLQWTLVAGDYYSGKPLLILFILLHFSHSSRLVYLTSSQQWAEFALQRAFGVSCTMALTGFCCCLWTRLLTPLTFKAVLARNGDLCNRLYLGASLMGMVWHVFCLLVFTSSVLAVLEKHFKPLWKTNNPSLQMDTTWEKRLQTGLKPNAIAHKSTVKLITCCTCNFTENDEISLQQGYIFLFLYLWNCIVNLNHLQRAKARFTWASDFLKDFV